MWINCSETLVILTCANQTIRFTAQKIFNITLSEATGFW
jgi:hypothetical protein